MNKNMEEALEKVIGIRYPKIISSNDFLNDMSDEEYDELIE